MPTNQTANENTVVAFLKMLEERQSSDALESFYHPEIEQVEFPNAILKQTTFRNLQDLKDGSDRGRKILQKESYKIQKMYAFENTVILEAIWEGIVAIPIGTLAPGDKMTANFAQFFEFRDGKIFRQRNYDCFEPFN